MKTVYDVQQLLKRFGTFIYTGDRLGDLELMMAEIEELYQSNFIQNNEYLMSILTLKREVKKYQRKKGV